MVSRFEHMAVPQLLDEPRQIRLFRRGAHTPGRFGCPIGFNKGGQVPAMPKRCAYYGEQTLWKGERGQERGQPMNFRIKAKSM